MSRRPLISSGAVVLGTEPLTVDLSR